ncbi:MAG: glycosyltransferase family 4 protein [Clostridium sp.]|nr:glycosyltransferase family 4 protein [Clostridium sp.]
MLSILINAYACSPGMGREPDMAWNWCVNLAKYCELHIITEGEFRERIEAVMPDLPQGGNMHFYYNLVPEEVRRMCWNQGDWRFYKYYRQWQWKTYEMARDIIATTHIDVMHQLNMIGFREPGYLWKIKDVPLVWGPVDAKEKFPVEYLEGAGWKSKLFMRLKNEITCWQLKYSRRVRNMVERSSVVISASSNSQYSFRKYFQIDSPLMNETGCYAAGEISDTRNFNDDTFDLLWVGKMDFRKQFVLALRAFATAFHHDMRLHVVGAGDVKDYQAEAEKLGVMEQCVWHGAVSHEEVQRLMNETDLFFFTSVAEGTPHVVLEAIGNKLPVLCFDTCGHGDTIDNRVGIKIPLSTPAQSVKDFAERIEYLYAHRDVLKRMSDSCVERSRELSWDSKARRMAGLYKDIARR